MSLFNDAYPIYIILNFIHLSSLPCQYFLASIIIFKNSTCNFGVLCLLFTYFSPSMECNPWDQEFCLTDISQYLERCLKDSRHLMNNCWVNEHFGKWKTQEVKLLITLNYSYVKTLERTVLGMELYINFIPKNAIHYV